MQIPASSIPNPTDLHLFGNISGTPAYTTKTTPVPNPMNVSPAINVGTLRETPATMQPTIVRNSPASLGILRPKTSLSGPAREKETAEAKDQEPTIHAKDALVPPKSLTTGCKTEATERNPSPIGGPKDIDRNYTLSKPVLRSSQVNLQIQMPMWMR